MSLYIAPSVSSILTCSSRRVLCPCLARWYAEALPSMPAPITITSKFVEPMLLPHQWFWQSTPIPITENRLFLFCFVCNTEFFMLNTKVKTSDRWLLISHTFWKSHVHQNFEETSNHYFLFSWLSFRFELLLLFRNESECIFFSVYNIHIQIQKLLMVWLSHVLRLKNILCHPELPPPPPHPTLQKMMKRDFIWKYKEIWQMSQYSCG